MSLSAYVLDNLSFAAAERIRQAYAVGFQRSILILDSFAGTAVLATFLLRGQPAYGSK